MVFGRWPSVSSALVPVRTIDHEEAPSHSGFRAFLVKSNALALAIGVIIGAALGAVVNSLVKDIIMPPIGWVLGGVDFASIKTVWDQRKGRGGLDRLGTLPQLADRLRRGHAGRLRHQQDLHQGSTTARPIGRGGLLTEIRDEMRNRPV